MDEMKIHCQYDQLVALDELQLNERNPNKHPENQIKLLAKILKYQGWRHPIIVSENSGLVVAGHGRVEAARLNGWTEVPIQMQAFDDEAAEYAFMVSDNSVTELSELDLGMINADFTAMGPDFDIELMGLTDFKIDLSEEDQKNKKKFSCPKCGYSPEEKQI